MTKAKKKGPAAKRRAARRVYKGKEFFLLKLSIARSEFGIVMSEVCPKGSNHLSDTLDGVVKVITHYINERFVAQQP